MKSDLEIVIPETADAIAGVVAIHPLYIELGSSELVNTLLDRKKNPNGSPVVVDLTGS